MSEPEDVVTPARWRSGSSGWSSSRRSPDRDSAGAGSRREQQEGQADGGASGGAARRVMTEAIADRSPSLGHQNKTKPEFWHFDVNVLLQNLKNIFVNEFPHSITLHI